MMIAWVAETIAYPGDSVIWFVASSPEKALELCRSMPDSTDWVLKDEIQNKGGMFETRHVSIHGQQAGREVGYCLSDYTLDRLPAEDLTAVPEPRIAAIEQRKEL